MSEHTLSLFENAAAWDSFMRRSPQASAFAESCILDSTGVTWKAWQLVEKGVPVAAALVLDDENSAFLAPVPHTMYQGLYLSPESEALPSHRRSKVQLNHLDTLLTGLSDRYERLSFSLHHTLRDLRAVQWFNYDNAAQGQFRLSLRYTGLINLDAFTDFGDWLESIRKVRRQEYRKALKLGLTIEPCKSFDEIEALLEATFARQGIERREDERRQLRRLVNAALASGLADQRIVRDPDGNALSGTVFLHAGEAAYYLVGANHPDGRNMGSGTFALIESLRIRHANGDRSADMCGINSPGRGDFKTSFNAEPVPYFDIVWPGTQGT